MNDPDTVNVHEIVNYTQSKVVLYYYSGLWATLSLNIFDNPINKVQHFYNCYVKEMLHIILYYIKTQQ